MDLSDAIKHAIDGDAVLFLGSGFSIGATNVNNQEGFFSATGLAHKLQELCGYDPIEFTDELGEAAELYLNKFSAENLLHLLENQFTVSSTSATQQTIASLNWKRVYTTNYDHVFEEAAKARNINYDSAVVSDRTQDYETKSHLCIHLNGDIKRLSKEKLENEFKLANRSYLEEQFIDSSWERIFRDDLESSSAIIFVGYSMQYDLDLRRIICHTRNLSAKTFFIVHEREIQRRRDILAPYGNVLAIGTDALAKSIKTIADVYEPVEIIDKPLRCFEKTTFSSAIPTPVKSNEVLDLILYGKIAGNKILPSITTPAKFRYTVNRDNLEKCARHIKNQVRNIIIQSELGNGKTIFLEELRFYMAKKGFDVFIFRDFKPSYPTEIERICNSGRKSVVIFDNYRPLLGLIKTFVSHRNSDQVLVLSERKYIHDIHSDRLHEICGDLTLIDINRLSDNESDEFAHLLEDHGLWGDDAGLPFIKKSEIIKYDCRGYIKEFMLKILESPVMINKYKDLVSTINEKEGFYDAILFLLIANVANLNINIEVLGQTLGIYILNSSSFRTDPYIRELINIEDGRIEFKSAIVSEVILQKICDSNIILDAVTKLFKKLDKKHPSFNKKQILTELMRFQVLGNIIPKKDKERLNKIGDYYEAIKTTRFCNGNPHFWLQFAILELAHRDYPQAKIYLKNAYGCAKRYNNANYTYDTYMIDDQYARFVLENELDSGGPDTCMQAFEEAHTILMHPSYIGNVHHFPYYVASLYLQFYEKFRGSLTPDERHLFFRSCKEVRSRLDSFSVENESHFVKRKLKKAQEDLSAILIKPEK